MSSTVLSPTELDTEHEHDGTVEEPLLQPGTDIEPPVLEGEIFTGPVILKGGEQPGLPAHRFGWLDARHLIDNPRKTRTNPADIDDDLDESVAESGVVAPLIVVGVPAPADAAHEEGAVGVRSDAESDGERFMVVMGHRRKYAAIAAGRFLVPCWIVPDIDAAQQIMASILENAHRTGLTPLEEAEAYYQLTLEGWSSAEIAKKRAIPTVRVDQALRVRQLPEVVQQAYNLGAVDADQQLAIEKFKNSPQILARLMEVAGKEWDFKRVLRAEEEKQEYALAQKRARAKATLDEIELAKRPKDFGYSSTEVDVRHLVDSDGNPVDVEQVKTQPGFAAFIEKDGGQARTVVYCKDPAALGYRRSSNAQSRHFGESPEQTAARQEREQREEQLRDELRLAAHTRHEFVVRTFGTAKAARKLFPEALRAATLGLYLGVDAPLEDLYQQLGGSDADTLDGAGVDRLSRSLVAKWICNLEDNLGRAAIRYSPRPDQARGLAWFDLLIAAHYPLSEAEQSLYDTLQPAAEATVDEDEDEEEDEEDHGELRDCDGDGDERDGDDGPAPEPDLPLDRQDEEFTDPRADREVDDSEPDTDDELRSSQPVQQPEPQPEVDA
ncbi:ParB/RepB/Spo0J family partition protein [Actinoplanes sp. NPDC051859]|uniref:ParB/RepB/Spo0J family partition protein n=1 Tax=Actinoplanes sp. NPDC051859 TaxID=3363909 RepID=UPI0037937E55